MGRAKISHDDGNTVRKALVALSIETVLFEIGKPTFDEVTGKLFADYKCFLSDCYEHPEYLKKILQDLYGKSSVIIIESIKKQLEGFQTQKGIDAFIKAISV